MNYSDSPSWPPSYTLRLSKRARTWRLQICPRRGLQIIVPQGFSLGKIPEIIEKHRAWIERTWRRVQPSLIDGTSESLPTEFKLLALNETWKIAYELSETEFIKIEKNPLIKQLILRGNINNHKMVKGILRRWLKSYARNHLANLLKELSVNTGLGYANLSIRSPKTRWGSCSTKKMISLSCKLLFLPPLLVEHVLLHELCHTVHMNHSRRFWDLLKNINPNCHQLRQQLKQAQKYIPNFED